MPRRYPGTVGPSTPRVTPSASRRLFALEYERPGRAYCCPALPQGAGGAGANELGPKAKCAKREPDPPLERHELTVEETELTR